MTKIKKKKQYREENKEKLNKKKSEKFKCVCGIFYTRGHKTRHERSKKHINFINNPN
jgi:hypothetical protein